jgi:DNA-binding YbaB/EbfC family protein
MKDLFGLLGKAKEMQARFEQLQGEIAALEAVGRAVGGLVEVTLSGKFEMRSLKIDPSLMKPEEGEILEDLIVAAHNEARVKVEEAIQARTAELTSGLDLPGGLKLPF